MKAAHCLDLLDEKKKGTYLDLTKTSGDSESANKRKRCTNTQKLHNYHLLIFSVNLFLRV
jgi:hypothetical protein